MNLAQSDVRPAATTAAWVVAVKGSGSERKPDRLVAEEPLEIRISSPGEEARPLAITMRTPGHDFELAAGFVLSEGLARGSQDIISIRYCRPRGESQLYNIVTVELVGPLPPTAPRAISNSSCGLCGKSTLEELALSLEPVPEEPVIAASVLCSLPDRLRRGQRVFGQTGGLHAAGVFDASGKRFLVREDVGRHNAMDKVIGASLLRNAGAWGAPKGHRPLESAVVMVSGRVGFEIVQKAAAAGVSVLAAVSAPSSLAVQAAEKVGMTVAGFLRDNHFNLYSNPQRVDLEN